ATVTLPPLRAWTSFALPARPNPMAAANPMLSLSFILADSRPLTPPAAAARAREARVPPTQHPVAKERKHKRKMTSAEKRAARSCCVE
ncbi:hypothetical protein PHYSODRAFT_417919, partial [Phytophthora sojae]